jgi:cytochrome c oxidase subunit 2
VGYGRTVRRPPGAWRLVVVVVAATAAAGCDLPGFGAPHPKSSQGESIYSLWQGFFITAMFVAALVWGLLVFVIIRYRRRHDDDVPDQRGYIIPLEIFYTVAPILVVAVLFGFSVATERSVDDVGDDPAAVVDVIGFQWSWQFHYPDEEITVTGQPGTGPELVLPVDRPSHLRLVSADVNHSFWVPDFLSKRDLIPGIDNEIEVTPTETGTYVGRCAEFCGLDHWQMNYRVRVVSEAEYQDWLDAERNAQADQPPLKVEIDDDGQVAGSGQGSGSAAGGGAGS